MTAPTFLTTDELAERLAITRRTVAKWRSVGDGPRFVSLGRSIRYRVSDVETWERSRTFQSRAASVAAAA